MSVTVRTRVMIKADLADTRLAAKPANFSHEKLIESLLFHAQRNAVFADCDAVKRDLAIGFGPVETGRFIGLAHVQLSAGRIKRCRHTPVRALHGSGRLNRDFDARLVGRTGKWRAQVGKLLGKETSIDERSIREG